MQSKAPYNAPSHLVINYPRVKFAAANVPETLALTPTSSAITVMSPAKGLVAVLVML